MFINFFIARPTYCFILCTPAVWQLWLNEYVMLCYVCRYYWHSAGSLGWPFPVLKYKCIFSTKIYGSNSYQTAHGNGYCLKLPECWLQLKKNKFIALFVVIFGTLSFPMTLCHVERFGAIYHIVRLFVSYASPLNLFFFTFFLLISSLTYIYLWE